MKRKNIYKIDANIYSSFPIVLQRWVPTLLWGRWETIDSFKNIEEAKAYHDTHELPKLPIYL